MFEEDAKLCAQMVGYFLMYCSHLRLQLTFSYQVSLRRGTAQSNHTFTLFLSNQLNTSNRAKAEMMQKKMLQMSKRIRQLEDAVQILQAHVSHDPHPLLAFELLEVKNVELSDSTDSEEKEHDKNEAEIYSDFGTLTISEQGMTRFVGRSGAEVKTIFS